MTLIYSNHNRRQTVNVSNNPLQTNSNSLGLKNRMFLNNNTRLNDLLTQLLAQLLPQVNNLSTSSQTVANDGNNTTIPTPTLPSLTGHETNRQPVTPILSQPETTVSETNNQHNSTTAVSTEASYLQGETGSNIADGAIGEPGYHALPTSAEQVNVVDKIFDFMSYERFSGIILDVNRDGKLSAGDELRTKSQMPMSMGMSTLDGGWKHSLTEAEVSAISGDWGKLVDVARSDDWLNPYTPMTELMTERYPELMRSKEITGFFDSDNNGQLSEGDVLLAKKALWLSDWNNIQATETFIKVSADDMAEINNITPNLNQLSKV